MLAALLYTANEKIVRRRWCGLCGKFSIMKKIPYDKRGCRLGVCVRGRRCANEYPIIGHYDKEACDPADHRGGCSGTVSRAVS